MNKKSTLLQQLSREVRHLFHILALTGEALHNDRNITIPQRAILEDLFRKGAQTIPQIAEKRSVSRQQIQKNVEELKSAGLVSTTDNPAHKRSFLVVLTDIGKQNIDAMLFIESRIFEKIAVQFQTKELEAGLHTLTKLKKIFSDITNEKEC